jgi:hypothetical protein
MDISATLAPLQNRVVDSAARFSNFETSAVIFDAAVQFRFTLTIDHLEPCCRCACRQLTKRSQNFDTAFMVMHRSTSA